MAKVKSPVADFAVGAAEVIGRAAGTVAGTIERLQEEHPHPIDEAREVIHEGQERVSAIATAVSERAASVIGTTRRVVKKARKAARKAVTRATKAKPKAKSKPRAKAKPSAKAAPRKGKKKKARKN